MTTNYRHQEPPFALQVELTEGCNLRCPFCGLNGIRDEKKRDYKFMPFGVANRLAELLAEDYQQHGWNPRIEFAMHGEPTLHPSVHEAVHLFRGYLPHAHLMMTSNGGGLLKGPGPRTRVMKLFEAGLNVLALDEYNYVNLVPKIRSALDHSDDCALGIGGDCDCPVLLQEWEEYEYPEDPDGNPHHRRSADAKVLVYVMDIVEAVRGNHARLNNHAGAAAPLNDSMQGARCAKPFRELSIRWDGNVAICCNDWRGTYKVGNVMDVDSLEELWNSAAMGAARRKLYHGERDFGPCKGCDARSYRVGLLPDKKGQARLPEADEEDEGVLQRACAGEPYTAPVLRPWEREEGGSNLPVVPNQAPVNPNTMDTTTAYPEGA